MERVKKLLAVTLEVARPVAAGLWMAALAGGGSAWTCAIVTCATVMAAPAADPPPPPEPVLRIETGMHGGMIGRIGADAACRTIITGSGDKTARLWAAPETPGGEPRLLRTLRPPIGPGHDGKVYAVALSPDGRYAAAGGFGRQGAGNWVFIFDVATGRLLRRLDWLDNVINHLAFSPNGQNLAAVLGGGEGMRAWETAGWRLIAQDRSYGGADSAGAAFDSAGRLYTVAYDGHLRRYDAGFRLEAKVKTSNGRRPFSVSIHPLGDRAAVGFDDSVAVEVYGTRDMKRLYAPDTTGVDNGALSAVSWFGGRLYAAGIRQANGFRPVRIWDRDGRGAWRDAPLGQDTVMHLLPCGASLAVATADPAFGLIGLAGDKRFWRTGFTPDMRSKIGKNFAVSEDGMRIRFGLGYAGERPVLFDLGAGQLSDAPAVPGDLAEPETGLLPVSDWQDTVGPRLGGKPLKLEQYEIARAVAIAPDRTRFALGADYWLRAYASTGAELWRKPAPGAVWGVNIPRDNRLIVAAYGDGTIRWHRLDDGQEILALFVHAQDRRWIAWTPKGYYFASPGAGELIGWHVNRGWEAAADFFPASRFRGQFERPDVVRLVLTTLDEERAVTLANAESDRRRQDEDIRNNLPPVINITAPGDGSAFSASSLTVRYDLRSPSGMPVKRVRALIDGRPVDVVTRGLTRVGADGQGLTLDAALPPRDVTLSLIAETERGASEPAEIRLRWAGAAAQTAAIARPKLYALLVGVSAYQDSAIPALNYAAKDARDLAAALEKQKGGLYSDVRVTVLTDAEATAGRVTDELDGLERAASQGDRVVVFFAGHGVTDQRQDYFFLPHDAHPDPNAKLFAPRPSTAVRQEAIIRSLRNTQGHALFLVDTCHAANATRVATRSAAPDLAPFIGELMTAENGVLVLASSEGRELSQESDEWGNGAFTKALLEGLEGKADRNGDGVVSFAELNLYIVDRVKDLTGNRQHPALQTLEPSRDLAIAVVGR